MKFCLIASLFFIALSEILVSTSVSAKNDLLIRAIVEKVPESAFASDVIPPENSYTVVKYKVLKVVRGKYGASEIKIAHVGGTAKALKVDDEVCIRIEPSKKFRENAGSALEAFGDVIPEELLADFVFKGFADPKTCF